MMSENVRAEAERVEAGSQRDGSTDEASPFGPPRSARSRWWRGALLVAVLLAAVSGTYAVTRGAGESAAAAQHDHGAAAIADSGAPVRLSTVDARRIGVTYAVASLATVQSEIRTVGQVTLDETRVQTVAPKVDGWVETLHVNFTGQPVRTGEPLLAIYSPMLITAQEELFLAKRLAADVAEGTPEARENAAELLESARRRLAYWDIRPEVIAALEREGRVRRTLTLYAPSDGFVIEKNVLQGQRIVPGDAVYRIADLRTVWVEGEVFEKDLSGVRLRQSVAMAVEALPGESFAGRVSYIYPTMNASTRTARVRIEVANRGLRLKPGMYATLRIAGARTEGVLSVPRSAVLSTGERHLVFVKVAGGMLEPRRVLPGRTGEERIEIREGLAPGDTVVASATFLVDAESNLGAALRNMENLPGMAAPTSEGTATPDTPPDTGGDTDPHAAHRREE